MSDKQKSGKGDNLQSIVLAIVLFLVARIFIFQPFTIPSASMEPGLTAGDYIIVTKWDYGFSRYSIPLSPPLFEGRILHNEPDRGDVIVFRVPSDSNRDYIKRLIGLPGDRVAVKGGVVWLNEKPLEVKDLGLDKDADPFSLQPKALRETLPGGRSYVTYDQGYQMADDFPQVVVPEGHYFFMGDNRDNSLDSRFGTERGGVGLVPAQHLIGRARIIGFSWDPEASLFKPWTWFTKARPGRFFKGIE